MCLPWLNFYNQNGAIELELLLMLSVPDYSDQVGSNVKNSPTFLPPVESDLSAFYSGRFSLSCTSSPNWVLLLLLILTTTAAAAAAAVKQLHFSTLLVIIGF